MLELWTRNAISFRHTRLLYLLALMIYGIYAECASKGILCTHDTLSSRTWSEGLLVKCKYEQRYLAYDIDSIF